LIFNCLCLFISGVLLRFYHLSVYAFSPDGGNIIVRHNLLHNMFYWFPMNDNIRQI
jgi:hypothetical protein